MDQIHPVKIFSVDPKFQLQFLKHWDGLLPILNDELFVAVFMVKDLTMLHYKILLHFYKKLHPTKELPR